MNLQQLQQQNPNLWPAVQEWIRDGWGVDDSVEITPLMVAAALEKEANFQDGCVAAGDSNASYPIRLRQLAGQLAGTAIAGFAETHTQGEKALQLALSILESFQEAGNIYDDYKEAEPFTDDEYEEMLGTLRSELLQRRK